MTVGPERKPLPLTRCRDEHAAMLPCCLQWLLRSEHRLPDTVLGMEHFVTYNAALPINETISVAQHLYQYIQYQLDPVLL